MMGSAVRFRLGAPLLQQLSARSVVLSLLGEALAKHETQARLAAPKVGYRMGVPSSANVMGLLADDCIPSPQFGKSISHLCPIRPSAPPVINPHAPMAVYVLQ